MARIQTLLVFLLASIHTTLAAYLTVKIPASQLLANPSLLPPKTHATLEASGAPLRALLTRSNKFVFPHVGPGSYLLSVHCRDYFFEPLRIDVGTDEQGVEFVKSWQTFRGNEWDNKGERRGEGVGNIGKEGEMLEAKVEVEVRALGGKEYYQQRQGFSALSLFKNPMILMAIFSLGLIVGMPYLLENMDPESRAEFEEMQKQHTVAANPAASLQNFDLAGWMAGSKPTTPSAEQQKNAPGARRKA